MKTVKPMFAKEKKASPRKSQAMRFGSLARPDPPKVTGTAVIRYNTGATANMTKRAFATLTILALFGNIGSFARRPNVLNELKN